MKTTFKKILMLITMLSVSINAFADWDFKVDNIYYEITDKYDNIVEVTHGGITQGYFTPYESSYSGDIAIPEQVSYNGKTYTVNRIGVHAFHRCSELTSVKIPDTVSSIGSGAFYYCSNLESVIIPNNVTSIGESAFEYCSNLESVIIPNRVEIVKPYTFNECNLKTIVLGVEVNIIEKGAFDNTNLTDITSLNPEPPHFYNDTPYAPTVSNFFGYVADKATLYVPKEALKSYMNSDVWKEFRKIKAIENGNVSDMEDDAVSVSAQYGNIVVSGKDNAVAEVYNLSGQLVYSGTDTVINVPSKGIYIVRVSGQIYKITVL